MHQALCMEERRADHLYPIDQLTYNCAWQGLSVYERQNGLNEWNRPEVGGERVACLAARYTHRLHYSKSSPSDKIFKH